MAFHDDLLVFAESLVVPVTPPHPEAIIRRAVSTAYYALFYLLIHESTTRGVPIAGLRPYVGRTFDHGPMKQICQRYSALAVDLLNQPVPAEIQRIAQSFVQL